MLWPYSLLFEHIKFDDCSTYLISTLTHYLQVLLENNGYGIFVYKCSSSLLHLQLLVLHSFQLPCSFPDVCQGSNNGFAFNQNGGLVALRSENYSIQLYSLFDDCGICEVRMF